MDKKATQALYPAPLLEANVREHFVPRRMNLCASGNLLIGVYLVFVKLVYDADSDLLQAIQVFKLFCVMKLGGERKKRQNKYVYTLLFVVVYSN